MPPYLLLFAVSLAGWPLSIRKPQFRKGFLLAVGTLFWLAASLRYVTGFDYRFYETIFQQVSDSGLAAFSTLREIEPGYLLLNAAVAGLGGNFRMFLFVFHLLFTALVFAAIHRWSPAPWLSVYLFLTLQYFALSMNFMRQALAAAIVLCIYPFLEKRRLLPCFALILLAACFHRTALLMLPLCPLLLLRVSKRHYAASALLAAAAYVLMDPLIGFALRFFPKYQHYLTEKYWQGNSLLYVLMPAGCFLLALPLLRRALQEPSRSPVLMNSVFYALLMQVFITRHFILERFSIYPAIFSLLALPEAALLPGKKFPAKARVALLLTGGLAYFLFAASQGFHGVYPFHGVWDQARTLST